ncbi:endonuclease III [Alicyclobacillus fastidiosus]|uniref:Endonuclease III n=1 Tax=Alicyclobacillus fastidiosus TaxID=392011 RepID=A0ABY6ZHI1_9BACL|nr:endonuclease III [Alicyclobacillus fastidiosus]WAH41579.1 endonuclease III [Alicyclobacillus fastidiosus]GMA63239.1 endonuclease III [Alicyclobacillus fastidiosus]
MALLSKKETVEVMDKLSKRYPDAKCALNHSNPFELLIATMLSAQCTDVRVNIVTERLFQKYRGPEDFAAATAEEVQEDIREVGLFRSKAQNIVATCRILMEQYGGEVPADRDKLVKLPGVGRKTANVVLSNAFGIPALAVDTHVLRVSNRIGLAKSDSPDDTERQICRRVPKSQWSQAHHWLIHHGRQICAARKPKCEACPIQEHCQYFRSTAGRKGRAVKTS